VQQYYGRARSRGQVTGAPAIDIDKLLLDHASIFPMISVIRAASRV
jgi:hypothetical protein